jgi:hypothetical protein
MQLVRARMNQALLFQERLFQARQKEGRLYQEQL